MLGSHAGISFDAIYKFQRETTSAKYSETKYDDALSAYYQYSYYVDYSFEEKMDYLMPILGFNVGFNVYF